MLNIQQFTKIRFISYFQTITFLSIAPSFIMMMTSFTRIVIVLSFLKQALGTQNAPSPKVIGAFSLFLTIFIMQPIYNQVYNDAVKPLSAKQINEEEAMKRAVTPLKKFMIKQTREKDIYMFMELSGTEAVEKPEDLSMRVLVPAFLISEIKTAFQMGFLIYLPFLVIDMVIATLLMSMGMMMLPPVMISLPFKLLLFVMVDGWTLLIYSLVASFG